ncbi:MAG: hypothetical protein ACKOX3_11800 [Bacteroidota bacterium]
MATDSIKYNIIRPGYMRRPLKNVKAHAITPTLHGKSLSRKKIYNAFLNRLFVVYNRTHQSCLLKESLIYASIHQNVKFSKAEKTINGYRWDEEYKESFDFFVRVLETLPTELPIKIAETVNTIFTIPAAIDTHTIFFNNWEVDGGKMPMLFDLIHNLFIAGLYQPADFMKQYDFDLFFYNSLPLYNEMISKFEIDYKRYEQLYVLYNLSFYYAAKSSAVSFSQVELIYYNRLQNRLFDLFKM